MLDLSDRSRRLLVRGQLALDASHTRLKEVVAERERALRGDGERGAQAVEYALLGGVSAAACTVVITVINNNHDVFSQLLSVVMGVLGRAVRRWF